LGRRQLGAVEMGKRDADMLQVLHDPAHLGRIVFLGLMEVEEGIDHDQRLSFLCESQARDHSRPEVAAARSKRA
jgi:hypothetical protein